MTSNIAQRAVVAFVAVAIAGCSASQTEPVAVDAPSVTTVAEGVDETSPSTPEAGESGSTTTDAPASSQSDPETSTTTSPPLTSESDAVTDDIETDDTDSDDVVVEATFSSAVAPVMSNNCGSCHNPGGPGSVHWNLSEARDVSENAQFIRAALLSGYMPPWPASNLGVAYKNSFAIEEEALAPIIEWIDNGAVLDVDPTTPVIGGRSVRIEDPDLVVPPTEPYDNESGRFDDYRCLVYYPEIERTSWLRSLQFMPDQTEVVHHAIGYLVPASQAEAAQQRDLDDPGSGWECYGGTGLAEDTFLVGWAPGQLPLEYPEGTGLTIEPGDFFVIQVHYHYEIAVDPDASWLEIDIEPATSDLEPISINRYLTPAEIPCSTDEEGPLCDREVVAEAMREEYGLLPADLINLGCGVTPAAFAHMNDGVAWSSCDRVVQEPGEIVSVLGHMHDLGAQYRMTLNPDTDREMILLDIPDWDYDWQYSYRPVETIELQTGDVLRFECTWERSRRDPNLEPAYVLWSYGSDDEMCFSTVTTRPLR